MKNGKNSEEERKGRNKMFTFGNPSDDQTEEFKSEISGKDEIGRIEFLSEEKEWMSGRVRNEIFG